MIINYNGYKIEGTPAEVMGFICIAEHVEMPVPPYEPIPAPAPAAPAPAPEPAKRKQKDFDTGKARALREAGWTFAKIADEMGVAPQTVANHLKEGKQ